MVNEAKYETALEQHDLAGRQLPLDVREIRTSGFVVLRGKNEDEQFLAGCRRIGVTIPSQPLRLAETADGTTLWISPDEFLHLLPLSSLEDFITRAETSLAQANAAVVDNSGGYSYLRLGCAEKILGRLCCYDVQSSLPAGKVVSTFIGKAPAILLRLPSDEAAIHILVRFSFADYAWRLLEHTAGQGD